MRAGSEFQVYGAETENAQEVKLSVKPEGLARKSVRLNDRNDYLDAILVRLINLSKQ